MDAPRMKAADRERAAQEEAERRTRLSLRIGVLGVILLFASGFGVWAATDYRSLFLGGMVVGILVILVAFWLVRGFAMRLGLGDDRTKIY